MTECCWEVTLPSHDCVVGAVRWEMYGWIREQLNWAGVGCSVQLHARLKCQPRWVVGAGL